MSGIDCVGFKCPSECEIEKGAQSQVLSAEENCLCVFRGPVCRRLVRRGSAVPVTSCSCRGRFGERDQRRRRGMANQPMDTRPDLSSTSLQDGAYSEFYSALQDAPHPSRNLQVPKDIDPVGEFNAPIIQRVPDPPAVDHVEGPAGDPVDALLEGGSSTGLSISTQEARDSGVILAPVLGQRASDNDDSAYTKLEDYPVDPSDDEDDNDEADDADDDADNLEQPVNPAIREEILSQEREAEQLSYRRDAEEGERQEVAQEVAHEAVVTVTSSRTLEQEVVQEADVLNPTVNNIMLKQTQADDEHVNTMLQQQVSRAPGDAQYILSSAFEPKSNNTDGSTSAQVISHDVVSILEPITLSQNVQEDKNALQERLVLVKNDSSESSTARSPSSSSSM